MAEIIRNTVKKTLDKQGRSRKWLKEQMIIEGLNVRKFSFRSIMNNTGRTIFIDELRVIAHILNVENIQDLLENKYKSNSE